LLVSRERIRDELKKIVERKESEPARAWALLVESGLIELILPDLAGFEDLLNTGAVIARLKRRSLPLFLAAGLFRVVDESADASVLQAFVDRVSDQLRLSQAERNQFLTLLMDRKRYRHLLGRRPARQFLAATRESYEDHEDLLAAEGGSKEVLELLAHLRVVRGESRPSPLVDGKDLIVAGFPRGRTMGWQLRFARVLQLEGAITSRDEALRLLHKRAGSAS
jgi:tRNA nucleotidyltransferase/poly(A) polymerase